MKNYKVYFQEEERTVQLWSEHSPHYGLIFKEKDAIEIANLILSQLQRAKVRNEAGGDTSRTFIKSNVVQMTCRDEAGQMRAYILSYEEVIKIYDEMGQVMNELFGFRRDEG